jgi:hypothetical protein
MCPVRSVTYVSGRSNYLFELTGSLVLQRLAVPSLESKLESGMPARTCGISRFVLWRSDRNCWWFRRAVPLELVGLIGKREWRQTLEERSRTDAEREAVPLLDETNRTIDLALTGNRPAVPADEIEAVAIGWWSEFRETRLTELSRRKGWTIPVDQGRCRTLARTSR